MLVSILHFYITHIILIATLFEHRKTCGT